MISNLCRTITKANARHLSTTKTHFKQFKVAIIGGAGATGQHIAFLLRSNPLIYKLCLYDVAEFVKGVGIDLSHVDSDMIVKGYGKDRLVESLECCDIVLMASGGKRKPNMKAADHWMHNAQVASVIARAAAKVCPNCCVPIVSNPVNAMVPLVSEIFKQECAFNPNHIFGLSYIDVSRSRVFAAEILGLEPDCVQVPVVGGHTTISIVPVFSQCQPPLNVPELELKALYQKVQTAGETVSRAKSLKPSTLSMAYYAAEFTVSLLKALNCETDIKQSAYVNCNALGTKYCMTEFIMDGDGVSKFLPQPKLSAYEQELLNIGIADINQHVKRGEKYAAELNPYRRETK